LLLVVAGVVTGGCGLMIGFWEILIVLIIILLVLGPKKLPELARAIGKAMRSYKQAVEEPAGKRKKAGKKRVKKPAG
jgi:sec-independent protein translocase protein TatA